MKKTHLFSKAVAGICMIAICVTLPGYPVVSAKTAATVRLNKTKLEMTQGQKYKLKVTGIKIKNVENDKLKTIPVDGVFVAVGHQPNTDIFKGNLVLDSKGYIVTHENCSATDIEGVFAAGDVKDPKYKQAVISAGSGAMAAMDAIEYLDVE